MTRNLRKAFQLRIYFKEDDSDDYIKLYENDVNDIDMILLT